MASEGLDVTFYSSAENESLRNAFSEVAGFDDEVPSMLEDIYGTNSKMQYELFIEQVSKKATWIFSAVEIRMRVHEAASVPIKHIK